VMLNAATAMPAAATTVHAGLSQLEKT
jgi:hypothetical protein